MAARGGEDLEKNGMVGCNFYLAFGCLAEDGDGGEQGKEDPAPAYLLLMPARNRVDPDSRPLATTSLNPPEDLKPCTFSSLHPLHPPHQKFNTPFLLPPPPLPSPSVFPSHIAIWCVRSFFFFFFLFSFLTLSNAVRSVGFTL